MDVSAPFSSHNRVPPPPFFLCVTVHHCGAVVKKTNKLLREGCFLFKKGELLVLFIYFFLHDVEGITETIKGAPANPDIMYISRWLCNFSQGTPHCSWLKIKHHWLCKYIKEPLKTSPENNLIS